MQTQPNFVHLTTVSGLLQANLIKSVLEAAGISTLTSGESAAAVYGFTVGHMADVELWIPAEHLAEAREIIAQMQSAGSAGEADDDDLAKTAEE